jgi:hypothetical protein
VKIRVVTLAVAVLAVLLFDAGCVTTYSQVRRACTGVPYERVMRCQEICANQNRDCNSRCDAQNSECRSECYSRYS